MFEERFADYLWELWEGKIPDILRPQIRQEGDVLYLSGAAGIGGAVILHISPWDNMAPLGFALLGVYWPHVIPKIDKVIQKRFDAAKKQGLKIWVPPNKQGKSVNLSSNSDDQERLL